MTTNGHGSTSDEGKIPTGNEAQKEIVMEKEFAIAEVMPGKLNAMVKNVMRQMDITDPNEAVRRVNSGEWVVVSKSAPEAVMPEIFRLTVDYGKSLPEMIAAGHYDWTNDDITAKRFPVNGEGIVEYEARYFVFDGTSSEDAIRAIESEDTENPWISAKIEHTLSHGSTFPEEQRKFPIVGLGSVAKVGGHRGVPCLSRDGSERGLRLNWFAYDWYPDCRFLAVRKVKVSVPQS